MRHFPKGKNFQNVHVFFQKNVFRFLSARYSADFRRSRLVCYLIYLYLRRRMILNTDCNLRVLIQK